MRFKDREIIKKCGLDAYFFLRYLQTLLVIFIPIAVVVIPVLVPINYTWRIGTLDREQRNQWIRHQRAHWLGHTGVGECRAGSCSSPLGALDPGCPGYSVGLLCLLRRTAGIHKGPAGLFDQR